LYLILLHRDGAQAETYDGAHGATSPPHTQADLGVGGRVRERELGPRDHVTSYVIARPCHVTVSGRRGGGTHKRHQRRDARARSTLALCRDLTVNTHGICTFFLRKDGRPSVALALVFLLIAHLLLILKGYL